MYNSRLPLAKTPLALLLFAFALHPHLSAQDRYVNASAGDNQNDGLTEATAWRTLTFGSQSLVAAGGTGVLHVAAGTYDTALGEQFPVALGSGIALLGPINATAQTIIDGGGSTLIMRMTVDAVASTSVTRLRNVSFRSASTGLGIDAIGSGSARVSNCHFEHCGVGAAITAPSDQCSIHVGDCEIRNGRVGIHASGLTDLAVMRTQIEDMSSTGIHYIGQEVGLAFHGIQVNDCTAKRCADAGLHVSESATSTGPPAFIVRGSTFAQNGTGLRISLPSPDHFPRARVARTSIVDNAVGVIGDCTEAFILEEALVAHNGIDVIDVQGTFDATKAHVQDGSIPAAQSGDPALVNVAAGDYRPSFSSPLIDRGTSAGISGNDGNLDLVSRRDWGSHELETMTSPGFVSLGTTVDFEVFGPAGSMAVVLYERDSLHQGVETPYGSLALDPTRIRRVARLQIQAGPAPTIWPINLPNDAALVGSHYFQVWVESNNAPAGAAFTNVTAITVTQ